MSDQGQGNVTMSAAELTGIFSQSISQISGQLASATLSSAIIHLNPPQFSGKPNENIHEWVEKFELLTLSFPDEQKTNLLDKAFLHPARSWFKASLKPSLPLPWKTIKTKILSQFSGESQEDRNYEALRKLSYDKDKYGTLSLFIDDYAYTYGKAYPRADPSETVRALIRNLTPSKRHKLNQMSDIKEISTVDALRTLAKRFDQEPESSEEKKSTGLDVNQFKELMSGIVKDIVEQQTKQNNEIMAAFQKFDKQSSEKQPQSFSSSFRTRSPSPNRNTSFRQGSSFERNRRVRFQETDPKEIFRSTQIPNISGPNSSTGKRAPPSPCYYCDGNHWNADCTSRPRNLNSNGR